jgi:hypothetical protein
MMNFAAIISVMSLMAMGRTSVMRRAMRFGSCANA